MKNLVRIECDKITFYKLKKGPRQMVSVASRLYRIDDNVMVKDVKTSNAYIFYEIDQTQPLHILPVILDPDLTRVYIDSAKLAGNKKSIWMNLSGSKLMEYLTFVIAGGAILWGLLSSGGF